MVDDLLLFSLPCFCRGAAPIGAVVIRKVTEARPPSGSGSLSYYPSAWRRGRRRRHEIRKNRAPSRNCGNCIIATPFSRWIANPASSFKLKRDETVFKRALWFREESQHVLHLMTIIPLPLYNTMIFSPVFYYTRYRAFVFGLILTIFTSINW